MSIYELQQLVGPILSVLVPLAGAIYTWYATQKAAARKEIEGIGKRLDAVELKIVAAGHNSTALASVGAELERHDRRIQSMEDELKHLPDKEAVHELKISIVSLEGTVKAMDAQLTGLNRLVANVDSYLRKGDEK